MIGFLADKLFEDYCIRMWESIVSGAEKWGASLVSFFVGTVDDPTFYNVNYNLLFDFITDKRVEGIIALSGSLGNYSGPEKVCEVLNRYRPIPVVSLGCVLPGFPSVIDEAGQGIYEVVSHLIRVHGVKKIGFIAGPDNNIVSDARLKAYKKALEDNRISYNHSLVFYGTFDRFSGTQGVEELFKVRGLKMDALACANDYSALYAIKALREMGYRVPEDILVTGYDDIIESSASSLTTVRQPLQALGEEAVKTCLAMIRREPVPEIRVLPGEVQIRESCGCSTAAGVSDNRGSHHDELSILLYKFTTELMTISTPDEYKELVLSEIPKLGIRNFYICLYEKDNPSYSKLFTHFSKDDLFELFDTEKAFPTVYLFPGRLKREDFRLSFLIMPLFHRNKQIGYFLSDNGCMQGLIYQTLRGQLSGAIKNIDQYDVIRNQKLLLEEELQKRTAALEERFALHSHLFAGKLELTLPPLALILGWLREKESQGDQTIHQIRENCELLRTLMQDFQEPMVYNRKQECSLSKIVMKKAKQFSLAGKEKRLEFTALVQAGLILNCDPLALEHLLNLLLFQALDGSLGNGKIEVRLQETENRILLEITDYTKKLPPKIEGQAYNGEGVAGMNVVRDILSQTGGLISFGSTSSECLKIRITYNTDRGHREPLQRQERRITPYRKSPSIPERGGSFKRLIFVISNEAPGILKDIPGEYDVELLSGKKEVLRALKKEAKPALFLAFLDQGNMDSIDLLHILESNEEFCNIPFLFIVPGGRLTSRFTEINSGGAVYLSKAVSREVIIQKINEMSCSSNG